MPASDRVKAAVRAEAREVQNTTQDAIQSGAYLYPLKGMIYYLSHRSLWKPLMAKIVPTLSLGVAIYSSMFFFTYLPQAAVLALFNGPVAAFSAFLLVLSEASTLFMLSAKTFLIEDSLVDTFDGTLIAKGETDLLAGDRQLKSGSDPIARLGKLITKPFTRFTPQALVRYLISLPLNLIPVVGTVFFILLQGKKAGPLLHARYFQLKNIKGDRREEYIKERIGPYTSFGVVATLLEMVPVAGVFFAFTNVTGAALWAADLEKKRGTAPALREQAGSAGGGGGKSGGTGGGEKKEL